MPFSTHFSVFNLLNLFHTLLLTQPNSHRIGDIIHTRLHGKNLLEITAKMCDMRELLMTAVTEAFSAIKG